jgi:hypothetical protein
VQRDGGTYCLQIAQLSIKSAVDLTVLINSRSALSRVKSSKSKKKQSLLTLDFTLDSAEREFVRTVRSTAPTSISKFRVTQARALLEGALSAG